MYKDIKGVQISIPFFVTFLIKNRIITKSIKIHTMENANFVNEVNVVDPDTGNEVKISIFKHARGGMFAIDSSFIEQVLCDDDDDIPMIHDPFETFTKGIYISNDGVKLLGV